MAGKAPPCLANYKGGLLLEEYQPGTISRFQQHSFHHAKVRGGNSMVTFAPVPARIFTVIKTTWYCPGEAVSVQLTLEPLFGPYIQDELFRLQE
jgi:hypothetical protein